MIALHSLYCLCELNLGNGNDCNVTMARRNCTIVLLIVAGTRGALVSPWVAWCGGGGGGGGGGGSSGSDTGIRKFAIEKNLYVVHLGVAAPPDEEPQRIRNRLDIEILDSTSGTPPRNW